MRLASIHTYPVKSCHRIDHGDRPVPVEPWGLAGDRRWLVVDPDGTLVTQREVAAMTQIQPVPRPGGLMVRAAGMPDLDVPEPEGASPVTVTVWRAPVRAAPAGAAAAAWFSAAMERDVRLVWLDDPTRRAVDPAYAAPTDRVSFADGYPLLLANVASLEKLNGWLAESGSDEVDLPMTRFRPNVVVAGAPAWAEDDWVGRRLRIGAVTFRAPKPCDRCVVTTTDQETGARGREPLRTLARHRSVDQKLLFGLNLIPDGPYGPLAAGDPVVLLPD
jgi:hypothetical protein